MNEVAADENQLNIQGSLPVATEKRIGELEEIKDYFKDFTDLPENLVIHMLDGCDDVDTEVLDFLDSDTLPESLDQIKGKLVFTHITEYMPQNGVILGAFDAQKELDPEAGLKSYNAYRSTIHGSLSHPVRSHNFGKWDKQRFVVLVPFEHVSNKIRGFEINDMFSVGPMDLGEGTRVISTSPTSDGNVEVFSPKEVRRELLEHGVIDEQSFKAIFDSVCSKRLTEHERTKDEKDKILNIILNEDGTLKLEAIKELASDNQIAQELPFEGEVKVLSSIESPLHYLAVKEILKMGRIPMLPSVEGSPIDDFRSERNPWENSGAVKFLRDHYNISASEVYKNDLWPERRFPGLSPWEDAEVVWRICGGHGIRAATGSEVTRDLISKTNQQEKVEAGIKLVEPGGKLWLEMMKSSWKDPKLLVYSYKLLRSLHQDLRRLR